ncbi:MAG: efflux transporter outer membrane subunit [Thermodesulfobacteriota bacterium]
MNLGVSSWEIDFFGRICSLKEKTLEEYLATAQARRSAQALLVSEVTTTFLAMAANQDRLSLASSTLDVQQSLYGLIQKRFQLGPASELDVTRARTQVEAARGDVARYNQLVAQGRNALELVVGAQLPEELLPNGLAHVSPPKRFSAGLSSEMLLRRPDILAAEHQLRAANANIGAARAAFSPRLSLTTALGTASSELTGLFKAGSGAWSYVPQLVMPIFDARLWSALEASKVQREIVVAQYERAIQRAFREVADALAEQVSLEGQLQAQEGLVQAAEQTHRLATARYMHGLDSYLSVLDAQRSLYQAQQRLVSLRLAMLANQVRLYAALGGGGNGNENPDS